MAKATEANSVIHDWKKDIKKEEFSIGDSTTPASTPPAVTNPLDAWVRDMEEIEKEINNQQ
jgi:hypothetical protein